MKERFFSLTLSGFLCFALFIPTEGFSQQGINSLPEKKNLSFVKTEVKIDKFYSKKDLENMPKLDLIEVYKSRLVYLIEVLPFLSLHPAPGSTFHDMAIPETESNLAHLEKEEKNKADFINSLFETLDDVIPYSEKDHLIWSILYFDDMIKKSDYVK